MPNVRRLLGACSPLLMSSSFVCAAAKEISEVTRLRSYSLPAKRTIPVTICEAALAILAATRFFDPVIIDDQQFVDGALAANNPVNETENEAKKNMALERRRGEAFGEVLCLTWDGKDREESHGRQRIRVSLPDTPRNDNRDGEYSKDVHLQLATAF